ncbi:MAG: uracil-DNA glycosylase [Acidobacteria bacterium]|nr:uracil-DNA glycosylase [Acidobacteriota bacterium]
MSSGETLANGPLSARVLSDPTPATLPARALFEMETKVTPMKPHTAMELLPANDTLEKIRLDLGECRRCRLCEKRKTIVFGCGAPRAELMLIGEGPGADEDDQGLPFVGRAGQLLTKILEAIQLTREAVYITNVIKCRPPQNRKPEADEVEPCHPFLLRQVKAIRPRLICALGATATQALLKTKESISSLRGRFFYFHGYKLIPTFHPAYLLRNPADKRLVWEDMQKVRDYLREQMPL